MRAENQFGAGRRRAVMLLVILLVGLGLVCGTAAQASSGASLTAPTSAWTASSSVGVSFFEGSGRTFGVGMPIIAYFSKKITDASVFDKVVTVTVNGRPAGGAWYWEPSARSDFALEAHYRPPDYWPGHATIRVSMPIRGLFAGPGLVFGNDATLTMYTGAAHRATINGIPGVDTMTITSDGRPVRTLRVSLGKATTPTYRGTAVAMAKTNPEEMKSPPGEKPPYDLWVPWSVRMTYSGEFIHDAYWNGKIGKANLSHGCTNLSPADAKWYYNWSLIGDPVTWFNTGTTQTISVTDGWGDWNLPFATYARGGLLAP